MCLSHLMCLMWLLCRMSLLKKLAGETALYGLSSILARFITYMLVPLYTRTLTKAENGTITELYAYAAFLMVILSYRLESAFSATAPRRKTGTGLHRA